MNVPSWALIGDKGKAMDKCAVSQSLGIVVKSDCAFTPDQAREAQEADVGTNDGAIRVYSIKRRS